MIKVDPSLTSKLIVKHSAPNSPIHPAKTVTNFCKEYHIGIATFYRHIGTDKVPKSIKIGKSRRIRWQDEEEWLANLDLTNSQGGANYAN